MGLKFSSLVGFLKEAVRVGVALAGFFKTKPSTADGLEFAITRLIPAVREAISYGGLDTREKFDSWLAMVDAQTGNDPGAVDLIPFLTAEREEEFFDHLVAAARCYGYGMLKVPGYYQPPAAV